MADALARDLADLRPDVLVVSGDLTQRARAGQFRLARDYLARLPTPQIVVPGNHDVPLFAFWRRIFSPFGRFRRFATPDVWPAWRSGDVAILGLNTACRLAPRLSGFWKDGLIDRRQCEQIPRRFAALGDASVRVLVAHHPFIEPPGGHRHGIVHNAAEALAACEQAQVDLILSGHVHMAYRADVREQHPQVSRPILNLVAGSAISNRRREAFNSYNVIRVEGGVARIELRVHAGKEWSAPVDAPAGHPFTGGGGGN